MSLKTNDSEFDVIAGLGGGMNSTEGFNSRLLYLILMLMCSYICEYTQRCVNPWKGWPYVRYIWLLTPVGHMCSIWLVVLVAANRYWAVCRPHVSARVWTTRRTVGYIAAVVVGVIAFNVPRVVEYRVEAVVVTASASPILGTLSSNATTDPVEYYSSTHIETGSESAATVGVEWTMQETRTSFGRSAFYRYVYKVLFVNILLVLLPLVSLIVLSVFVIKTLRQTPSYRLSLLHARPRLPDKPAPVSALPAAEAPAAAVGPDEVIKDDDIALGDDEDQRQQQDHLTAMMMNGELVSVRMGSISQHVNTTKRCSKFSLRSLKVCLYRLPQ